MSGRGAGPHGSGAQAPVPPAEVGVAIVRDGPRILVARRARGNDYEGLWEFPGGHREAGETIERCVEREVLEEVGIEVRVGMMLERVLVDRPPQPLEIRFFECELAGGRAQALAAARSHGARWVDAGELAALAFPPANRGIVERLARERESGA